MTEPSNPWSLDTRADYHYPMETLRHRYVTPFGGTSFDLKPWEIGVNAKALRARTSLNPTVDRVMVSAEVDPRTTPLIARPMYRIVPLTADKAEALALSPHGEVVFSCYELDARDHERSPIHALREGDPVTLNAVLSKHWATSAEKWESLFRLNRRDSW
ncbi:MAG TPA: hypothetical protein VNZ52_12020 [Candidatus Thermoplasmatota archaeon]|nr:hypothetical protein [Candidatus Thermoplasmatota archaeon]